MRLCSMDLPVTKKCGLTFEPRIRSILLDFTKATGIPEELIKEIEIFNNSGNPKPVVEITGSISVQNGGKYVFAVTGISRIQKDSFHRIS